MKWHEKVNKLLSLGFTQTEIATHLGCSQALVGALSKQARGKNLNYETGSRLIELLKKAESKAIIPAKPKGKRNDK